MTRLANSKSYLAAEIITSIKNEVLKINNFISHFINYRFRHQINDFKNLYRKKIL
jgi:hypothetical protein